MPVAGLHQGLAIERRQKAGAKMVQDAKLVRQVLSTLDGSQGLAGAQAAQEELPAALQLLAQAVPHIAAEPASNLLQVSSDATILVVHSRPLPPSFAQHQTQQNRDRWWRD